MVMISSSVIFAAGSFHRAGAGTRDQQRASNDIRTNGSAKIGGHDCRNVREGRAGKMPKLVRWR
jgi:hypothetical protein